MRIAAVLCFALFVGCSNQPPVSQLSNLEFKEGVEGLTIQIRGFLKDVPVLTDRELIQQKWNAILEAKEKLLPVPQMKDADIATKLMQYVENSGKNLVPATVRRITAEKLGDQTEATKAKMLEDVGILALTSTVESLEKFFD